MKDVDTFWRLEALPDRQLLDRLSTVLGSGRRLLAELIAHLGEVEERRLHLDAACSSMFGYCLTRLGMSEDEACRRIDAARLARRYPAMFPLLATGQLSLTVAALLKPHLSEENHEALLAAVSGKSVRQAREVIAARFPLPDVRSSLRKLPERGRAMLAAAGPQDGHAAQSMNTPLVECTDRSAGSQTDQPTSTASALDVTFGLGMETMSISGSASERSGPRAHAHPPPPSRIEPLSAERYKVQFTADAELKGKIELARDLTRHSHPSGDFGPIIERALDLLIEDLMKRRFGVLAKRKAPPATNSDAPSHSPTASSPPATSRYIGPAVRRSVLERDGLRCSWVDALGVRCDARAWLEYDHHTPHGKGGGSAADNVRLLCRSHNGLAAEREYGRQHIERSVAKGRSERAHGNPP